MNRVNIFERYEQRENDYTNGLISLLSLSPLGNQQLLAQLLNERLDLPGNYKPTNYKVLRGIDGYADGEISASDFYVLFETKIISGTLREDQIRRHLQKLDEQVPVRRYLILLTPDDGYSSYVKHFLAIDPRIRHLEWRCVYDLLEPSAERDEHSIFSELAKQFRDHVREKIFEQDLAGGILKISFGEKSGVCAETYLDEMRAGEWVRWNTPRQYKSLDGTGRKLMLYDRERQGITIEVEIGSVIKTHSEPDYPWTNEIVGMKFFIPPIPLDRIRSLENFQDFGVHRKDRNAFRNLTREQYRLLVPVHK